MTNDFRSAFRRNKLFSLPCRPVRTMVSRAWQAGLFLLIVMWSMTMVSAQNSEIGIRFANPQFDCESRTYCLDVEYQSNTSLDSLFGTNVRFFYNSTELIFVDFRNFAQGYGLSVIPVPQTGVPSSGSDLFNFDANEAAVWINGAIELQNLSQGKSIGNGVWTKFYEACFNVVGNPEDIVNFCPTLIWDLREDASQGGFFQGDNGVVITLLEGIRSRSASETVEHFNWMYSGNGSAPYGEFADTPNGCFTSECVCNIVAPTLFKSP